MLTETFIVQQLENNATKRLDVTGRNITYSTGDSLEVRQTFATDSTKHSQALTRRVRNTALTATLRWEVDHTFFTNGGMSLFDYMADIESLCGAVIVLTFNGQEQPRFLVKNVGVSATVDAIDIYRNVSLSLELVEGHVEKKTVYYTAVGVLDKGKNIASRNP